MSYGNYPDLKGVKKILVIKLRHLGDVLLTSPLFSSLKKALPAAEIDAYLYKDTYPMLQGHPDISTFHLYDRKWKQKPFLKRVQAEGKLLWAIRKSGYDLIINLTEGDRGALAAKFSAADYRVGFDGESKGVIGKNRFFTHLVKNCPTPRHAVERNLDALRRIGIFPEKNERELKFVIGQNARDQIDKLLAEKQLVEKDFCIIHPISRWRFKCPPKQKIVELIELLLKRGEEKIILTSGPDQMEKQWMQELLSLLPQSERILSLAGQLSIKEFGALMQRSKGVISVDSMAIHLASALKTPLVAIFGPTSVENWGPWMHPSAAVVSEALTCRPCLLDGCGGSKMSDCLYNLSMKRVALAYETVSKGRPASALFCEDFSLNSLETLATE